MAKFDIDSRKMLVYDIIKLCYMQLRDSMPTAFNDSTAFLHLHVDEKFDSSPFKYIVTLKALRCDDEHMHPAVYDMLTEAKDFLKNILLYVFNEDYVSVSSFDDKSQIEFEIAGKV